MKVLRNVLLLSALAATSFSCTIRQLDEGLQPVQGSKQLEFTASIEDDAQTRSSVDAGLNFYWSPRDQVNLFYGETGDTPGSLFTSQNTQISQSATFSGTLSAFTGTGADGVPLSFWGVFPYSASNRFVGDAVLVTLPSRQRAVAENFAEKTMLMVAKSSGLSMSYRHVGSMIRIRMSRSDIVSVTFRGNDGEIMSGRVSVTMDSAGNPVWSAVEGQGSKSVRLESPDGFVPGTSYYLYFLPQTLAHGWSLIYETADGQAGTYTSNKSITFQRATASNANGLDARATFQEQYVEMAPGVFWATMNVGASAPEEYGDYFAWGETSPKADYSESTYTATTYQDAATANWGGDWRTPSQAEWQWLISYGTWTSETLNGVSGYRVTSSVEGYTDKSIFLPLAGYRTGTTGNTSVIGRYGYYWTSSPSGDGGTAYEMQFATRWKYTQPDFVYIGEPIRPVKGMNPALRDYVELGPGVKWATMNVGASSPEDYGDYFAWGETYPKDTYLYTNHKYMLSDGLTCTKYVTSPRYGTMDGRTALEATDDAATANWGGDWRTPTVDEWSWLQQNCTWTNTTQNGVEGILVTSNVSGYTDRSIFLPKAGVYAGPSVDTAGEVAWYWSSSKCPGSIGAYLIRNTSLTGEGRRLGTPIRAVCMPRVRVTSLTIENTSVTLGVEETYSISSTIEPSDATEKGVIWSSSNPAVVSVDYDGQLTGISPGTARIIAWSLDGNKVSPVRCQVTVIPSFVDMGGGMEWATYNVGASSPEGEGTLFAWGEVSLKTTSYTWDTYRLGRQYNMFMYNLTDGLVTLQPNHDAAQNILSGLWHMPSLTEWRWLLNTCTWNWVSNYESTGVSGYSVTSPYTGGTIFLPVTGVKDGSEIQLQNYGSYWSSSLVSYNPYKAYNLAFSSSLLVDATEDRYKGLAVRAVRHKAVDMGNGVKWATTNVGGFFPEDTGDYFAWGEVNPKYDFYLSNYKWTIDGTWSTLNKYVTQPGYAVQDNYPRITTSDDAARLNWGKAWHIPTVDEWNRLVQNCTWTWTDSYQGSGSAGYIVRNGANEIFLPAAGYRLDSTLIGYDSSPAGYYWTSMLNQDDPKEGWSVQLPPSGPVIPTQPRFAGLPIRAVTQ